MKGVKNESILNKNITGPVTITNYQKFQWVREQLGKERHQPPDADGKLKILGSRACDFGETKQPTSFGIERTVNSVAALAVGRRSCRALAVLEA